MLDHRRVSPYKKPLKHGEIVDVPSYFLWLCGCFPEGTDCGVFGWTYEHMEKINEIEQNTWTIHQICKVYYEHNRILWRLKNSNHRFEIEESPFVRKDPANSRPMTWIISRNKPLGMALMAPRIRNKWLSSITLWYSNVSMENCHWNSGFPIEHGDFL